MPNGCVDSGYGYMAPKHPGKSSASRRFEMDGLLLPIWLAIAIAVMASLEIT